MLGEISLSTSPQRQVKFSRWVEIKSGEVEQNALAAPLDIPGLEGHCRRSLQSAQNPMASVFGTILTLVAAVVDMAMARPGVNMAR